MRKTTTKNLLSNLDPVSYELVNTLKQGEMNTEFMNRDL